MTSGGSNKLLTVAQVADILNVSRDTVYDKWREWGLKCYRVGTQLRFREREVWAWLESNAA